MKSVKLREQNNKLNQNLYKFRKKPKGNKIEILVILEILEIFEIRKAKLEKRFKTPSKMKRKE